MVGCAGSHSSGILNKNGPCFERNLGFDQLFSEVGGVAHFGDPALCDDLQIQRARRGAFQRAQQAVIVGLMLNLDYPLIRYRVDHKVTGGIQLYQVMIIRHHQH